MPGSCETNSGKGVVFVEFYHLEAFAAVVACRSFSRAAERLFLSQPTISAHIKSLETELGVQLFDRGKGELMLTPAGDTLYRYAKDMLEMREHLYREIAEGGSLQEETVTVGASSVPCQYLLPPALAAFAKEFRHINVSLRQDNSHRVCEGVFNYQYPLGMVGERVELPRLQFEPLVRDELIVAVPVLPAFESLLAKEILTLDDLAGQTLLIRERGSGTRSLFERALQQAGVDPGRFRRQVFGSQEAIKQAVRCGLGLSVLSRYVVEDYLACGLLEARPLADLALTRQFWLVTYEKRVQTPGTRSLIAFLRRYFQEER